MTAVGGMVFGATNSFNPNTGYDLISRLLAIVILGGMGSIAGAMAAAVFMLVINDVVAVWWSPTWAPLVLLRGAGDRAVGSTAGAVGSRRSARSERRHRGGREAPTLPRG